MFRQLVPESEEGPGRASETDVVRRGAAVSSNPTIYECLFVLPSGSGLWPDRDVRSRHHFRRYAQVSIMMKSD